MHEARVETHQATEGVRDLPVLLLCKLERFDGKRLRQALWERARRRGTDVDGTRRGDKGG